MYCDFHGYETWVDLLILDMVDFDVILGMHWLAPYHDFLDCYAKTVTLSLSCILRITWKDIFYLGPKRFISSI